MASTQAEAAILWFDASIGTGAVQMDDGRHLRFFGTLPFTPRPGRKVLVTLDPEGATVREQVIVRPLPGGRNENVEIEEVTVEYALAVEGLPAVSRPRGVEVPAAELPPEPALPGVRRRSLKTKYPAKSPGEAFPRGMSVRHATYGHGFVQMSTLRVARVQFGIQERQVRVDELAGD